MSNTIDFAKLGGPVYLGRTNGEKARQKLHIEQMDKDVSPVAVLVPDETYTINSSYFLGLFGASVVSFGTKEAFFDHYKFQAPPRFLETVDRHAERALREQGVLKIA